MPHDRFRDGPPPPEPESALERALEHLVAQGVLTAEQAAAVRAEVGATSAAASPGVERGLSPAAEVAAYAGGVLAVTAAVLVAAQLWEQVRPWAQLAMLALAAAVLWGAGRWVAVLARHAAEDATRDSPTEASADGQEHPLLGTGLGRLAGFLWLLAAAAAAAAAWVAAEGLLELPPEPAALVLGLAATAFGWLLWRARPGALQLAGWYAGVLITVGALLALPERPPSEMAGLGFWAVGVATAMLAWGGLVHPLRTGLVLGAATSLAGAQAMAVQLPPWGLGLGLATAAGLLGAGARLRQPALLGLGCVGLAVFVPQLVEHFLPGSLGAAGAVFIVGVVLLGGALATVRGARSHD